MNKTGAKILVNALTVFRCIFTFAMPFLISKVANSTFLYIIIFLYLTDWIDGFLSRKWKVQTLFGSIMDTFADKVLCIVLIYCIKNVHWTLLCMLIGEILIGTMNLLGTVNGASIVSIYLGKVKMWLLALATLAGYMCYFQLIAPIYAIVFSSIVLVMQVFVIFGYGSKMGNIEITNEKRKWKRGKELTYALFNTEYYLQTVQESILNKLTLK